MRANLTNNSNNKITTNKHNLWEYVIAKNIKMTPNSAGRFFDKNNGSLKCLNTFPSVIYKQNLA